MPNQSHPVQLQANTAGAWKTVLQFDARDDAMTQLVQQAVSMLYQADDKTHWRIATIDRSPDVLHHLSKSTFGIWIGRKESV